MEIYDLNILGKVYFIFSFGIVWLFFLLKEVGNRDKLVINVGF